MALTKVSSSLVSDNAITTGKLVDGGVHSADIATNAITSTKIAQNSILTKHIDDGQVTTAQLGADAVTAAKIADDAISEEHLDVTVITSLSAVTAATGDLLMVADVSDSNNLKKIPVSSILAATHTGAVNTSSSITSASSLTAASGGNEILIGTDGNIEITRTSGGAYIDFKNSTSEDFDQRIQATSTGHSFSGAISSGGSVNATEVRVGNLVNNGTISANAVSGKQALTAKVANNGNSLFQGFNASDALITQITGAGALTHNGTISSGAITSSGTGSFTGGGNTLSIAKGSGSPALAFLGTATDPQTSALIEGIAGGGLKFYTSTGALSSPSWSPKITLAADGATTFTGNVTASRFIQNSNSGSNLYAAEFSRSGTGTTTPDIWGSNNTLVLGTSASVEAVGFSGANAEFYGTISSGAITSTDTLTVQKSSGTTLVKTEVAANSTVGLEIKKTGATTSNWRIVDGQTVNGSLEIYDVTDSRQIMVFDGDGDIGMGVTPATHAKLTLGGTTTSYSSVLAFDNNTTGGATFFMLASDNTWSAGGNKFLMGHGSPSSSAVDVAIDADGKVGIGESSPDGLLHLKGGTATGDASHILFENTQGSKVFAIGGGSTGVTNSHLYFRNVTDNTRPMVITDAGNIGIGGIIPVSKLHVDTAPNGSTPVTHIKQDGATNAPTLFIEQVGNGGNNNVNQGLLIKVDGQNSGLGNIIRAIGTNSNLGSDIEAFTVKGNGRVGIGTTGPNAPLEVSGGVGMTGGWGRSMVLRHNFPVLVFQSEYSTDAYSAIGYDNTSGLKFFVNTPTIDVTASGAIPALTILDNHNVGIGEPSPDRQLHIKGSTTTGGRLKLENTSASYYAGTVMTANAKEFHIGVGGSGTAAGFANNLYFYDGTAAANRMFIDTSGSVAIGGSTVKRDLSGSTSPTLSLEGSFPALNLRDNNNGDKGAFYGINGDTVYVGGHTGTTVVNTYVGGEIKTTVHDIGNGGALEIYPHNTSNNSGYTNTVIGFYNYYKTNAGAAYAHMKTNFPTGSNSATFGMIAIEATGYKYNTGQTVKGMWGFHNWNGGTYSSTAENLISSGGHNFCHSTYVSSDGFIVLVANAGGNTNCYLGARLDFIDIQADYAKHGTAYWPPKVTAVSYSANTTGVY